MREILNTLRDELNVCNEVEDANTISDNALAMSEFIKRCRTVASDVNTSLMDDHNIYLDDMLEDVQCEFDKLSKDASSEAEVIQDETDAPTIHEQELSMFLGNSGVIFG